MEHDDITFRIAAARRMLYRNGCMSHTAGQVSVRAAEEDALLTTPIEEFDETLPDHVVKYSFELERSDQGGTTVSPAVGFHAGIYLERPDVNAIVHHHGHNTATVASTGEVIGQYNTIAASLYEDQAQIFDTPEGMGWDAKRVPYALGEKNVLLMQNHGCIAVGETLEVATVRAIIVEAAARFHVTCGLLGGTPLTDEEQLREYKRLDDEYRFTAMWRSGFRRLRQSDPDLFAWVVGEQEAQLQ